MRRWYNTKPTLNKVTKKLDSFMKANKRCCFNVYILIFALAIVQNYLVMKQKYRAHVMMTFKIFRAVSKPILPKVFSAYVS